MKNYIIEVYKDGIRAKTLWAAKQINRRTLMYWLLQELKMYKGLGHNFIIREWCDTGEGHDGRIAREIDATEADRLLSIAKEKALEGTYPVFYVNAMFKGHFSLRKTKSPSHSIAQ